MMEERPRVIAVMGPTAVGKSGLALQLAKELDAEVVNADSVQVYRHLEIGTAKPTPAERAEVRHHLLDIVDPAEDFDVGRYNLLARAVIRDLGRRGRPAIVVGGTGLYLKVLFHGLVPGPACNEQVRRRLRSEAGREGCAGLYQRLAQVDAPTAERLHPHDVFRIIRALEVWECTGRPLSELQREHGFQERPFRTLELGLHRPRAELYDRINRRIDAMMARGFLKEVTELLARGYGPHLKSMQSLGYRHLVQHLMDQVPLSEALQAMKRDTRHYAKRQMTWFRRNPEIHWFGPEELESIARIARQFVEH
ncbi:MAG: tRNA (adenosine(37)-N6)-dimethylallyltransferase MiaA [Syntrophobacteria bacterium]